MSAQLPEFVVRLNAEGARKIFGDLKNVGLRCRVGELIEGVYMGVFVAETNVRIAGFVAATGFDEEARI